MGRLPVLSGRKLIRLLGHEDSAVVRRRGSHVSLSKGSWRTVVPLHDELATGTHLGIPHQCGLTRDDLERMVSGK